MAEPSRTEYSLAMIMPHDPPPCAVPPHLWFLRVRSRTASAVAILPTSLGLPRAPVRFTLSLLFLFQPVSLQRPFSSFRAALFFTVGTSRFYPTTLFPSQPPPRFSVSIYFYEFLPISMPAFPRVRSAFALSELVPRLPIIIPRVQRLGQVPAPRIQDESNLDYVSA